MCRETSVDESAKILANGLPSMPIGNTEVGNRALGETIEALSRNSTNLAPPPVAYRVLGFFAAAALRIGFRNNRRRGGQRAALRFIGVPPDVLLYFLAGPSLARMAAFCSFLFIHRSRPAR
jgi:hypothetical protein